MYGFEVIGGMGTSSTPAYIQCIHSFDENKTVVLRLTSELNPKKYEIFFDKLFDSLTLLIQLKSMDIYVVGTLSEDLTRGCPFTTGSAMCKDGCGTVSQFVEKNVGLLSVLGPITEGGESMAQGQVFLKVGGLAPFLFNFFKVYHFYI